MGRPCALVCRRVLKGGSIVRLGEHPGSRNANGSYSCGSTDIQRGPDVLVVI